MKVDEIIQTLNFSLSKVALMSSTIMKKSTNRAYIDKRQGLSNTKKIQIIDEIDEIEYYMPDHLNKKAIIKLQDCQLLI